MKDVTFTKRELLEVFDRFLNRLVDMGNDRQDMIEYHIDKLVGIPYSQVVRKMPRGPKGRWWGLMSDTRSALRDLAEEKSWE